LLYGLPFEKVIFITGPQGTIGVLEKKLHLSNRSIRVRALQVSVGIGHRTAVANYFSGLTIAPNGTLLHAGAGRLILSFDHRPAAA